MDSFFQIVAITLASLSVLLSITVIIRLRQPVSPAWWGLKVFVSALSPFLAMVGALSVFLGIITGSFWVILPGSVGTLIYLIYLYRVYASINASTGFMKAYGPKWETKITSDQQAKFLSNVFTLRLPPGSEFNLMRDIPFCTIPGTRRQLLCDLWQPAENVKSSGLAFIYFHGSAWCVLDKDFGTRTFFRHMVSQGHVIMDVAYRLFPETDMAGMVNDVYRAIAWIKTNSSVYGVNPQSIVIGGGSAGAHLSLLAAYNKSPRLMPEELLDRDLTVSAVISIYGPTDLKALYYHTGQHITTRERDGSTKKAESMSMPKWVRKMMGDNFHRLGMDIGGTDPGNLSVIMGCHPDECPEVYDSFSPITYVHAGCPPTLIIQGEHDLITSEESVQHLYKLLTEAGVPVVMNLIPQTDHAFDLVLPGVSPLAHTAFYFVERFLALQVK
jgi:acetyl esterase/lipase